MRIYGIYLSPKFLFSTNFCFTLNLLGTWIEMSCFFQPLVHNVFMSLMDHWVKHTANVNVNKRYFTVYFSGVWLIIPWTNQSLSWSGNSRQPAQIRWPGVTLQLSPSLHAFTLVRTGYALSDLVWSVSKLKQSDKTDTATSDSQECSLFPTSSMISVYIRGSGTCRLLVSSIYRIDFKGTLSYINNHGNQLVYTFTWTKLCHYTWYGKKY